MSNWIDNLPTQEDIEFRRLCDEVKSEKEYAGDFFERKRKEDFPEKRRGGQGHERLNDENE